MTKIMKIGLSIEIIAFILTIMFIVTQQPVPDFIPIFILTGMAICFAGVILAYRKHARSELGTKDNKAAFFLRKCVVYVMLIVLVVLTVTLTVATLHLF